MSNDWTVGCIATLTLLLFTLLFIVVVGAFTGWLVSICLVWFGVHVTWVQGWLIAITVGLLTNGGNIRSNSK